jgi:2-iminobutanoate/2-iminopropanoate deaminase
MATAGRRAMIPVNPPGATFAGISQAMRVAGGEIAFLSGHVPVDEDGDLVVGDFEAQLDAAFRAIGRTLAAAGAGYDALARLTIYVVDYEPGMLATLRRVRERYVSAEAPPASVFIAVAALYDPRAKVEIDGFAVIGGARS